MLWFYLPCRVLADSVPGVFKTTSGSASSSASMKKKKDKRVPKEGESRKRKLTALEEIKEVSHVTVV